MMWRRLRYWFLPAVGFAALVAGIVLVNQNANVAYPLSTWRMDLDDLIASVGIVAVGVAAIWTVWLKAKAADQKASALTERVNGGLKKMAEQHVAAATAEAIEAGHYVDLLSRVTTIEQQRDDCHEDLAAVRIELSSIQDWVVRRLDDTGNGRGNPR
jgi:hypothetical protein